MSARESAPPRPRLATQLEQWALVREKVLDKLDIRGARAARDLAARIRDVVLRMAEEGAAERGSSLAELRTLCSDANTLLTVGTVPTIDLPSAHTRATLPVPPTVAAPRPPSKSRRPPRPSGVTAVDPSADRVKNHALRRKSAAR